MVHRILSISAVAAASLLFSPLVAVAQWPMPSAIPIATPSYFSEQVPSPVPSATNTPFPSATYEVVVEDNPVCLSYADTLAAIDEETSFAAYYGADRDGGLDLVVGLGMCLLNKTLGCHCECQITRAGAVHTIKGFARGFDVALGLECKEAAYKAHEASPPGGISLTERDFYFHCRDFKFHGSRCQP